MEIVEGAYKEFAEESTINENQRNALKNVRKNDKNALFLIYQGVH